MAHLKSLSNCTHLTPAGLPFGIPGIGLLIDGAVQQAPQFGLHSINAKRHLPKKSQYCSPRF
ncbi:MAG: hypothetical protein BVN34_07045 [Proteobacteria bacterium ST_bin12]|nr:MAG: hypothetical protein BVN34_07045 [Proteobacteria bacterium ST_bin12]